MDPSPSSSGQDAQFVEAGSLRVDRERAISKLERFQSERPQRFILSLVRCAVLGGASRFEVRGEWKRSWVVGDRLRGYRIRFDGRPFRMETVRDPFGPLFSEEPSGDRRGVLLARALIDAAAVFRLAPSPAVSACAADGKTWTEVAVAWEKDEEAGFLDPSYLDQTYCAHAPLEIVLRDVTSGIPERPRFSWTRPAPPFAAGQGEICFEEGGVRGKFAMPRRISPEKSRLSLCSAGVHIEKLSVDLPGVAEVDGFIDDPELDLDFKGTGAVRDLRYEALLSLAGRQALRLLLEAAREQTARLAETGALLAGDARLRDCWTAVLEGRLHSEPRSSGFEWWDRVFRGGPQLIERRARVFADAVRTRWLRYCGRGLTMPEKDEPDEAKRVLWGTPTYFTTDGEPVSPLDMWGRLKEKLPLGGTRRFGPHPRGWTLWLGSSRDAPLLPERIAPFLQRC